MPSRDLRGEPEEKESLGVVPWDLCTLPPGTRLPRPEPTGAAKLDHVIERWVTTIEGVLEPMHLLDRDLQEVWHGLEDGGLPPDLAQVLRGMASDVWPQMALECAHGLACAVREGRVAPGEDLLAAIEAWLWTFDAADAPQAAIDRLIREFTDVLSMPMWGRRRELYSDWVVTQIDEVLERSRLVFDLHQGTLRFPFNPAEIASVETADGPFELWSVQRSSTVCAPTHWLTSWLSRMALSAWALRDVCPQSSPRACSSLLTRCTTKSGTARTSGRSDPKGHRVISGRTSAD